MSEATTGVPAAKASVSTMPNDSPPERRRAQDVRARERGALRLVVDAAERGHAARVGEQRRQRVSLDADHGQPRGDVLAQRLEGAQQHRQPLALDRLADERDLERLARRAPPRRAARRPSGSVTPLGTIRYSPPKKRRPVHSAASDTAIRTRRRFMLRLAPHSHATACGSRWFE